MLAAAGPLPGGWGGGVGAWQSRDRPSQPPACPKSCGREILTLAEGVCRDYNDQHLTEVLQEEHGLQVSRASVRRIRRAAGLASPHKYRRRKGHLRRERYPQAGMLFQIDASHHAWLEDRGPQLALVAAIDDATNQVVGALFREHEDAAGYFLLLQDIAQRVGLPLALYADRHTIFQSPSKPTIEQELAGISPQSQFGQLTSRLGIRLIAAHSPQAKGRIERLWGTCRIAWSRNCARPGPATLDEANQVLTTYLAKHNQRFAISAEQPGSACQPLPQDSHLDRLFSFHYTRRVANDHMISLDSPRLATTTRPQRPQLCPRHRRSVPRHGWPAHRRLSGPRLDHLPPRRRRSAARRSLLSTNPAPPYLSQSRRSR